MEPDEAHTPICRTCGKTAQNTIFGECEACYHADARTQGKDLGRLRELVFLALGEASMCWSDTPTGVFDDERAVKIGNNLLEAIKQHEAEALTRASLSHYMHSEPREREPKS